MLSSGLKDLSKDELLGLVEQLIAEVSALRERVGALEAENAALREEVARLKGPKGAIYEANGRFIYARFPYNEEDAETWMLIEQG